MLYDILPPTIFMLSLGGIIVILSRVVMRMQKAEVSASMQVAAETQVSHQRVLRPTQKSVQAVTSRAAVAGAAMRQQVAKIGTLRRGLTERLQERREARDAKHAELAAEEAGDPPISWRQRMSGTAAQVRTTMSHRLNRMRRKQLDEPGIVADDELETHQPPGFTMRREVIVPDISTSNASLTIDQAVPQPASSAKPVSTIVSRLAQARLVVQATPAAAVTVGRAVKKNKKRNLTVLEQARDAISAREYQHAEDILVEYIVKHTKDTNAYMLLGEAAVGREDWQEAAEIFEQVITWNPDQPRAYALLGLSACRAGRYSKALQALQRAHEADPEDVTILTDLLSIARKMDNPALQKSISEKLIALESVRV